jgi:hypothetical protein
VTAGESMVWATTFSRIVNDGGSPVSAARHAAMAVKQMHAATEGPKYGERPLDAEAIAMLDEMRSDDREGPA